MTVVRTLVRSLTGREQDGSEPGSGPDASDGTDSALFHCPRCDTVYIAGEKDTCSDCGTAVNRVPSALSDR